MCLVEVLGGLDRRGGRAAERLEDSEHLSLSFKPSQSISSSLVPSRNTPRAGRNIAGCIRKPLQLWRARCEACSVATPVNRGGRQASSPPTMRLALWLRSAVIAAAVWACGRRAMPGKGSISREHHVGWRASCGRVSVPRGQHFLSATTRR